MSEDTEAGRTADPRLTETHAETLIYTDIFFGGFCVYSFILGAFAWHAGQMSGTGLLALFVFVASNAVFTQVSIRLRNPFAVELARPVLGGIICPLAYVLVDGPLAPWWAGYIIMCLGGAIALGIVTERPFWGRVLVLYYVANFAITTYLREPSPDWYLALLNMGVIAMTGLMFAQLMSILGRSLKKEHERSLDLAEAHRELTEVDRLKSDFFANISHEFRTPITLTLGPIDALKEGRYGDLSPAVDAQLDVMRRNQQRLLGLVNQILDLAKVEEGRMEIRAVRIDSLSRFLERRTSQFEPLAAKRGLELETLFDPAADEADVFIDVEKFDKIVFNLLSNAIKFTRTGWVRLETLLDEDTVVIRVVDTGIGISKEDQAHIFDRFRQAEGGATREFSGTGIGLSLVKELTVLHGGTVSAHGDVGKGSAFEVRIPTGCAHFGPQAVVLTELESTELPDVVEVREGLGDDAALQRSNESALRERARGKPLVLYVDDNADLRAYVTELLRDAYAVLLAVDGAHGLELARAHRPDVILSDLMMPKMTGLELCAAVRQDAGLRSTPFVVLTAKDTQEAKLEGLSHGADDYLGKPFSPSEVSVRIRNLLLLRQRERELAEAYEQLAEKDAVLKEDLEEAEQFQRSIMPEQSCPQWLAFRAEYRPAEIVGGDVYDVCEVAPGHVRVFLADAVGHGVQASLRTIVIKTEYDRVKSRMTSPAQVLSSLNRALVATPVGLVPACCLDLVRNDDGSARIVYANAGHPPVFKVSKGEAFTIHRRGPFLSMLDEVMLEDEEQPLEIGDRLFMFTDGLYEQRNARSQTFGQDRVVEILAGTESTDATVDSVLSALSCFSGSTPQADDLTVIAMEYKG